MSKSPIARLDLTGYEFADFGCSGGGGSIDFAMAALGLTKGVGLDIDPAKIAKITRAGYHGMLVDLASPISFTTRVGYVTMFHFLEHLPSIGHVRAALQNGVAAARRAVFVRTPWFDADEYLFRSGLKFTWSDWHGHTTSLTLLQTWRILEDLRIRGRIARFAIYGKHKVIDSSTAEIVPLSAAVDALRYDKSIHGEKPEITFTTPMYRELESVLLMRNDLPLNGFKKFDRDRTLLYDSDTRIPLKVNKASGRRASVV